MKKIAFYASMCFIGAAPPAYAATYSTEQAVEACTVVMQNIEPGFMAYIVNDGTGSRINEFGTSSGQFKFDYCLNLMGHPVNQTPIVEGQ